jgi:hypothetical protein
MMEQEEEDEWQQQQIGGGGEFGLATAAAAVPHVVAALRGGRPFVPSISRDHNRGQCRDSSSRRKQLLCTRCYLDEVEGMSSSLEAKKNQAGAKKSSSSSNTTASGTYRRHFHFFPAMLACA